MTETLDLAKTQMDNTDIPSLDKLDSRGRTDEMVHLEIEAIVSDLMTKAHKKEQTDSQNVLELLAITMFADKQVLAAEIQAFTDIILRFQRENILATELSEAEIINWYEDHKEDLKQVVNHNAFEPWISEKIRALRDFPDKHLLLRGIDEIAEADGEKHVSEKALEVITAKKWAESLLEIYSQKAVI